MKDSSDGEIPKRDPSKLSGRLQRYVIATCYRKMKHRMNHKTLSKPYVSSLRKVNDNDICFDPSEFENPSAQWMTNDWKFLNKFLKTTPPGFQSLYPALLKQAGKPLDEFTPLYTQDTCVEFHQLFNFLLERFEVWLGKMDSSRGDGQGSDLFKDALEYVFVYGYALQRLAHGAALRMHLQSIPNHLLQSGFVSQTQTGTPMPAPGDTEEEPDVELKAVQPLVHVNGDVESRVWKSYVDWLRLIIVHFDSVDVLAEYFTGSGIPDQPVTIHIVFPREVDNQLLSWRKLFADNTLFPTTTPPDDLKIGVADIQNADLLKFLNTAVDSIAASHAHANALTTGWNTGNLSSVLVSLQKLKNSKMPCWGAAATSALSMLEGLDSLPKNGPKPASDIITAISQSAYFFKALASIQPQKDFRGSMHCEAFLVSLLHEAANGNEGLAQLKVGLLFQLTVITGGLIACDRTWDQPLEYQNVAAPHANI